jgi:LCP family protein required for cell wall assembly
MDKNQRQNNRPRRISIDGFSAPPPIRRSSAQERLSSVKKTQAVRKPAVRTNTQSLKPKNVYPTTYLNPRIKEEQTRSRRNSPINRTRHNPDKPEVTRSLYIRRIIGCFIGLILLILIGTGGFLGYRLLKTSEKVFGGSLASNLGDLFGSNVQLKGESTGRVNILLAGDSADDPGHAGAQLTDSILLLSVDTKDKSAFLLSIPRDLWVQMPPGQWPGGTYQKINAANEISNFSQPGYPNGGMGALSYVIQNDLGIPVDYYGLMDYGAFTDSVNAVGGVTITIKSPDPRGLYDPNTMTKLPNGPVTLNGQQALNLARSRGDGYGSYGFPNSDFDRTEHQRQVFIAVAQKAQSLGVLSNPAKISNLFSALGNNLNTNLNLADVLTLINITKGINVNSVASHSFCSTLSVGLNGCQTPIIRTYTDPATGQEALIPVAGIGNYGQLTQYYNQLTSNNPVVKEGASVEVLNGTNTGGLAVKNKNLLQSKGVFVAGIGDAENNYQKSTIIDNSAGKDPATLALLKSIYGNNVTTQQLEGNYTTTFVVIVGNTN